MGDLFTLSSHAVILNEAGGVLLLKQTYGDKRWGLPGGTVEQGETVFETLMRECLEELNVKVKIHYLSGVYFHKEFCSHVFIFRCSFPAGGEIRLSAEHSQARYFGLDELSPVQRHRVKDCIQFDGFVKSGRF